MEPTLRSLNNPLCRLAECPLWNESEGRLYWTDITQCRIWRYDPKSSKVETAWSGDMQVGGFAFAGRRPFRDCGDGSMLLCTDKGVFKRADDDELIELYDVGLEQGERFNDVTTDALGRVFAGTMKDTCRDGRLFLFEKGHDPVCLLEGLGISNGMGFSSDSRFFYHTDSAVSTITRYDYDVKTGRIAEGRPWYKMEQTDQCPDGLTVDSQDCLWLAVWGGARVIRLDASARQLAEIPIPAVQVSSLTFGGDDFGTLYVTTAAGGAVDPSSGKDAAGRFLGGRVYELDCGVKGRPEWPADF